MNFIRNKLSQLQQYKNIFFITIPFGIILLFIFFFLLFTQTSKKELSTTTLPKTGIHSASPTLSANISLKSFLINGNIFITTLSPGDNSININPFSPISLTFSQPVPLEIRPSIQVGQQMDEY